MRAERGELVGEPEGELVDEPEGESEGEPEGDCGNESLSSELLRRFHRRFGGAQS